MTAHVHALTDTERNALVLAARAPLAELNTDYTTGLTTAIAKLTSDRACPLVHALQACARARLDYNQADALAAREGARAALTAHHLDW